MINDHINAKIEKQIDRLLLQITALDIENEIISTSNNWYKQYSRNDFLRFVGYFISIGIRSSVLKNIPHTLENINIGNLLLSAYLSVVKNKLPSHLNEYFSSIEGRFFIDKVPGNDYYRIIYNNPHHGKYA